MKILSAVAVAMTLSAAVPAVAGPIVFEDDFSTYGTMTQLNAPTSFFFPNWTVTNGTVDYIRDGSAFGDLCLGNTACIDLDGSTSDSGLFETTESFGSGYYDVFFQIAGSHRDTIETVLLSFGSVAQSITLSTSQVSNQDQFGLTFKNIFVGAGDFTKLSFQNESNDNIGIVLKNVLIEKVASVPVPAAGGLLALGIGALAAARRRKAARV